MKKILCIVTQSELGGAQKYVLDLSMGLKNEFNIYVGMGGENNSALALKLKENNIEYFDLKNIKRQISPINDFLAIFEIIKLIKKLKPDIIHLNSSKVSILGSIAAKICYVLCVPCYVIYTVHGWVFNEPLPKWKKLFYKLAEKFTSNFKDKIICISKLDYEIAKTQLKIPEKKLTLIHHGIKPINFLSKEEALSSFPPLVRGGEGGWETTNPPHPSPPLTKGRGLTIGTIANLYKTKGLEYFIEAVKILVTDYRLPVTAIIIGEGEERKNLENIIAQNNLEKTLFLAGKIDNAPELLNAFDIYVSSSVKEGFPYAILEAMQAGLPIVSTNVGGIPEMIENKKNGLLVEPQNPQELAEKIKILIEDENLRKKLGRRARIDAIKKFGIEGMVEKTKEIYKRS